MVFLTKIDAEEVAGEALEKIGIFQQYVEDKIPEVISMGVRVLLVLVLYFIGSKLIKWARKVVARSMERTNAEVGVRTFADSALKIGLHIALIVFLVGILGVETTSIAALFASCGVALGLALQGSLSNLAGGILILILKPFEVGDYIIEDSHKNEGTVKEIQIFYTKIATIDNKTIVIPNGILANNSLINVTGCEFRQLDLRIDISYDADLKKAKDLLNELLLNDECIEKDRDMNVFVDNLGNSSVILGVRAWVRTEVFMATKWRFLEDVKLTFDKHDIEIPFNQLTVHLDNQE